MSGEPRKFKYSLQPLLTKLGWEADTLKVELLRLNALLGQEERRMEEIKQSMRDAEQQLRTMQAGEIIQVEKKEQIGLYLKLRHELLRNRQIEWSRLCSLRDQVMVQMGNKKKSVKALERHRDRKHTERVLNENRLELKEADGNWLARLPRKRVS